ncbi:uncharacterized protein A4U43_C03F26070 [Asparagus officinalis]|uniref:Small ribosomal subunit protein eS1 n=1 Tax=Asparagus officinalis TaxID=4686 RepID=A0A5P1FI25_ASPOF|nr:uncharacterized protein A4U43_C03F26070 [Asparagus officinalis]
MAVGKNKRISKGKKGGKKKAVDPFAKKDWYDIKAPSVFNTRNIGKTLVSRTQGTRIASEGLKHRVFEVSLADLQTDEDQAYRKIRLRAEDIQGKNVLTNFWGMDFTTDKLRSLVRKWQTLIEAHVDVKTTDNDTLRMFCIAFTKRRPNQNVFIRKVKILKAPKFDLGKLMEVHGDYSKEDIGARVDRPAEDTPMEGEQQEIVGA